MKSKIIKETLIEIENQLGLKLNLYDGVLKTFKNENYELDKKII